MKRLVGVVSLGLMVCFLSACGKSQSSPRIVCNVDGTIVPTAFTFEGFRKTLAAEHKDVEAIEYTQLKTSALIVSFKPLPDGTVLAENVIVLKSTKPMTPAFLFGLTKSVRADVQSLPPAAADAAVSWATSATNSGK